MVDARCAGNRPDDLLRRRQVENVPAARIFHGLSWPGTNDVDIDHVVLVGDRVAVIDSKYWTKGHYEWTGTQLWADGREEDPLRTAAMAAALESSFQHPVKVRAWVVQQNPQAHVTYRSGAIPLVTPRELADDLEEWLVTTNPYAGLVDRRVLLHLIYTLKSH